MHAKFLELNAAANDLRINLFLSSFINEVNSSLSFSVGDTQFLSYDVQNE